MSLHRPHLTPFINPALLCHVSVRSPPPMSSNPVKEPDPVRLSAMSQCPMYAAPKVQFQLNPQDDPIRTDPVTRYICICYITSSLLQNNIRQPQCDLRESLFIQRGVGYSFTVLWDELSCQKKKKSPQLKIS